MRSWVREMRGGLACLLLGLFFPGAALLAEEAAELVAIQGELSERGTRTPLGGVNVFILPHKLKGVTDGKGRFRIEGVPAGPFVLVVNFSGYKKLERKDEQQAGGENRERSLYLEKIDYGAYETTVFGKGDKRDDTTRSLKATKAAELPGSGGDPIRAVQNLPGVNRAAPLSSMVVIQGSAPYDTRYTIDGHEVPLIFHFGGLSSVIMPEALDRVDYLSAGYGPEYGRALGGLVGVWSREPKRDRLHGYGFVDIFNAGAMLEGPVGEKSSFLLGARQSYIGAVLKAALKNNSNFNLTVAPAFSDLVGTYDVEVTPIDRFRLLTVGSNDTLEFLLSQPSGGDPAFRGRFSNQTAFYRLIPEVTHRHGAMTTSRLSLGIGRDWFRIDAGDVYFRLMSTALTVRGEVEHKFSDEWLSHWGIDNQHRWSTVEFQLYSLAMEGGVMNPFSTGEPRQASLQGSTTQVGGYWRNEVKIAPDSDWTFFPSLRTEHYSVTRETFLLPRAAVRWKLDDSLMLRTGGGLYVQPPQDQEVDKAYGNPDVKAPHAAHLSLGAEKDLRGGSSQGWVLSGGGFYRFFDQLVVASSDRIERDGVTVSERYNNSGKGRAYGAEAMIKMDFAPWTGWLSYTLSRSTRWNKTTPEAVFQYDQTHLLTAVAGAELGEGWRLGLRFRYATGNPFTPVVGGNFDADNDVYLPIRGPFYSERLEPFYQLDLRFDKRWVFDKWILSGYLDIQNVTNRQNVEQVRYSYDYTKKATVAGLPMLPTFGIRGEF